MSAVCALCGANSETESVTVSRETLNRLLAVATLYVESFKADEMMTLPEKMNLQYIEEILEQYGKRY